MIDAAARSAIGLWSHEASGCATRAGFAPALTGDYACVPQESRDLAFKPQELDFSPELDLLP